jgi:hypothetical protein
MPKRFKILLSVNTLMIVSTKQTTMERVALTPNRATNGINTTAGKGGKAT